MTVKKSKKISVSKNDLMPLYRKMLLIRRFEEKAGQLYGMGHIGGFCHLYIGQEAVVVGLEAAAKDGDNRLTSYRDHAHMLACGLDPKGVMAELTGRKDGLSKGKGGSMHMFNKEVNLMGGHGIVGAQIPMGAGIAFADQYKGNKGVTYCSFGDGAARQGALHETFNMAMMWKLPVVFIIENNNYAMGTSVKRTTNVEDMSEIGKSYHMPSFVVDGMSVEAVHEAIEEASARARSGEGPTLLDIRTYRYKGHSMSDPQKYRTKDEVEDFKGKDPVSQVLNTITVNKLASESDIKKIQDEVKVLVDESIAFAEESAELEPHELYEDVYMQKDYPFIKD